MITLEALRDRREELLELAARHKAENVRVFGSVARGDANEQSDVDLLVHFRPDASLFDLMDLRSDVAELLRTEVDVVSDGGVSPYLKEQIFREAIAL